MKQLTGNSNVLSISILLFGIILGYFNSIKLERALIEINFNSLDKVFFDFSFLKEIIVKNVSVSLLISIGGYFTAGTLTIFTLLWNGFNLGSLFTYWRYTNLDILQFSSLLLIHGVFEFIAFIMFANIGFQGVLAYKRFLKTGVIQIQLKPQMFLRPTIILIFASIVETFLYSNF